jgi:hypothetical protein
MKKMSERNDPKYNHFRECAYCQYRCGLYFKMEEPCCICPVVIWMKGLVGTGTVKAVETLKVEEGKIENDYVLVCPYCGESKEIENEVFLAAEVKDKFPILMENSRNKTGLFLCEKCGNIFFIKHEYFIRIVNE